MPITKISYPDYLNRVIGGWIGKCIGGATGAAMENNKSLMHYTLDNVFPDPNAIPPNDDLDLQVLYLQDVLERIGPRFDSRDIARSFAEHNLCMANEYAVAVRNIHHGVMPPLSGVFNNDYFKNSMGCPIRSEIWAFVCPGDPNTAVELARIDGCIDHASESISGEQFNAALEALAFVEQDVNRLLDMAMSFIPEHSELAGCVRMVRAGYLAGESWEQTREKMLQRYGSADASYSVPNLGLIILALLHGQGDMEKTLLHAINGGFDTDCTAATAATILGVMLGADKIPGFWLDKIGHDIVVGTVDIKRDRSKVTELGEDTCKAGLSFARDGITQVEFTDVPEGIEPSLPEARPEPEFTLEVEYEGDPTIGVGETRTVVLQAVNATERDMQCRLSLNCPDNLTTEKSAIDVMLPAFDSVDVAVEFSTKPGITELPTRNIVSAVLTSGQHQLADVDFGLMGAWRMKLIGPFWDNYDTTKYDADPYQEKMQRINGVHDFYSMFSGWANINREYIDESFADIDELPGTIVNIHHDIWEMDELVKYKGPCCVYLVWDMVCPDDKPDTILHIGNNDAYRVWLNGDLVAKSDNATMWMPYNMGGGVNLKKGTNRFIFKLARTGNNLNFSLLMRSGASRLRYYADTSSVVL